MRLEFVLPNEIVTIYVDLADHPGAVAWAEKFHGHKTKASIHNHLYVPEINVTNEDVYDIPRQQCLETLKRLHDCGITYTGLVPNTPDDVIGDCLNQLHRFFTHTQQDYNILQGHLNQQNQDPENKLPQIRTIIKLLQDLNHWVHEMEAYCVREHDNIPVAAIEEIKLYTATECNTPNWLDLTPYRDYHTDQPYDVILSSEVLGKTLLQSYIDGDDPTDWDTSGHHSSAGGLQICLTDVRQKLYQSQHFKNWLEKHNADKVWYDFPIGNIQNWEKFQHIYSYLQKHQSESLEVTYYK